MYVKLVDNVPSEWPVSDARIRNDNPLVSFPNNMALIDTTEYGFAPFEYSDPDTYDTEYQTCTEVTPVLSDGVYVQTWQIADKYTAEERAEYDNQKEQDRLSQLPSIHRGRRDFLLSETDWWATSDRTMSQSEIDYRQALRDITLHENWPDLEEADWPTKP